MRICGEGHDSIVYQLGGCPVCNLGRVSAGQIKLIEELRAAAKAAPKPPPYKRLYVLGEGYPRQGGSTVWLRQNRERAGSVDLSASWPVELCDGEPPDDLPQYRLVLERVDDGEAS